MSVCCAVAGVRTVQCRCQRAGWRMATCSARTMGGSLTVRLLVAFRNCLLGLQTMLTLRVAVAWHPVEARWPSGGPFCFVHPIQVVLLRIDRASDCSAVPQARVRVSRFHSCTVRSARHRCAPLFMPSCHTFVYTSFPKFLWPLRHTQESLLRSCTLHHLGEGAPAKCWHANSITSPLLDAGVCVVTQCSSNLPSGREERPLVGVDGAWHRCRHAGHAVRSAYLQLAVMSMPGQEVF